MICGVNITGGSSRAQGRRLQESEAEAGAEEESRNQNWALLSQRYRASEYKSESRGKPDYPRPT
jgi:hypothetical protein